MSEQPRKLMWFSNAPWEASGYGQQSQITGWHLREQLGYEVAYTAFHGLQGAILPWLPADAPEDARPFLVYPNYAHQWGSDIMTPHAKHFGARVVISLMDIWVIDTNLIGQTTHEVAFVPYFPIDCEPLPPSVEAVAKFATKRIVFSRFGEQQVLDADLDCYYVPHSIDMERFQPVPQDEARKALGLPQDAFIFGMVAANQGNPSRKALTEQMLAFRHFKETHSDAVLFMHTTLGMMGEWGGENLMNFAVQLGLRPGVDVFVPQAYAMTIGFSHDHMRKLFSAFDVLMNVSKGEGFGVPIAEAQACGTPVITGAWTAQDEVCKTGWKIPKQDAVPWWYQLEAWQYIPRWQSIVEQMELAYQAKVDTEGYALLRQQARERIREYDARHVTEHYWKPTLESIYGELEQKDVDFNTAIDIIRGGKIEKVAPAAVPNVSEAAE